MPTRMNYDHDLDEMTRMLVDMGNQADEAIGQALLALKNCDHTLAAKIAGGDETINHQERVVEHQALSLLLRQQPVATDLRRVSTAFKMVTDLERIGDHAVDISEIVLHMEPATGAYTEINARIIEMGETARTMVRDAVTACKSNSEAMAQAVIARDDTVDTAFNNIKETLAAAIAEKPDEVDRALDDLMIIKYLERVADHAVNVAEWVKFLVTGKYKQEDLL